MYTAQEIIEKLKPVHKILENGIIEIGKEVKINSKSSGVQGVGIIEDFIFDIVDSDIVLTYKLKNVVINKGNPEYISSNNEFYLLSSEVSL